MPPYGQNVCVCTVQYTYLFYWLKRHRLLPHVLVRRLPPVLLPSEAFEQFSSMLVNLPNPLHLLSFLTLQVFSDLTKSLLIVVVGSFNRLQRGIWASLRLNTDLKDTRLLQRNQIIHTYASLWVLILI